MKVEILARVALACCVLSSFCQAVDPSPKPWPLQFHAQLIQNTSSGDLAVVDLWYDWTNGRNYNIIQHQLDKKIWDLEWNNGTSYYFDLEHQTCKTLLFPVGVLRPDWLDNADYLGVRELDGFICNVWEKLDFITYFEDVKTQRPVGWLFYTGSFLHVISFEEGAVLSDPSWQAPSYCFRYESKLKGSVNSPLLLHGEGLIPSLEPWKRWLRGISTKAV